MAVLAQVLPQADDIGHRPVGNKPAEAAFFLLDIQNHLRIARHALELAQVTDDARVLHQPLQVLGAHEHDFFRVKPKEHLLEGRPLGVHHAVLQAGAKHPQRQGRQVAVIADLAQFRRGQGHRQVGFQLGRRTKPVQTIFVQPLVIAHALS